VTTTSCEHAIAKHQIWYHYPVLLRQEPVLNDSWVRLTEKDLSSFDQRSYFHRFVSDRLFGSTEGTQDAFETYQRQCVPSIPQFGADKILSRKRPNSSLRSDQHEFAVKRFVLTIAKPEIRLVGKKDKRDNYRGVAVLSVKARICGVKTTDWYPTAQAAVEATEFTKQPFTLTEAMCASDWIRRVYPRWWDETTGLPGDSLSRVVNLATGNSIGALNTTRTDRITLEEALLPWVTQLFDPISFHATNGIARIKGEERAYMSSVIAIETHPSVKGSDREDAATISTIPDGDLLRLAEADSKFPGDPPDNYSRDFMEPLKDRIFYDRHEPHPETEPFRSTRFLITEPHLCAISSGDFARSQLPGHFDKYYRHMQFLCVFEKFRLLQFSEELTELVSKFRDDPYPMAPARAKSYFERLAAIRHEFLNHTHLHHFSNVSPQIQPAEMFEMLYAAFGIKDLHAEVEQELANATAFAEAVEARQVRDRSERLNQIASIGVPTSLGLALAALWFQVSSSDAFASGPWLDRIANNAWGAVMQTAGATAVGFVLWTVATMTFSEKKRWPIRETYITVGLAIVVFVSGWAGGWI
jgi:hypothetical protein